MQIDIKRFKSSEWSMYCRAANITTYDKIRSVIQFIVNETLK